MKVSKIICICVVFAICLMNIAGVSAQSRMFSLGVYNGIRLSDNQVLDSKDPAADLTITPRYKGYVAYATLQGKKLEEFAEKPDLAKLSAADVENFKELVFAPTPGYYYLVKSNDNRYYLCKLDRFENQGKAATYWKLTFSYEEIRLGSPSENTAATPKAKSHGKKVYPDGTVYEGGLVGGEAHGEGSLRMPDGSSYEGEFVNGSLHGRGILKLPDGACYEGDFVNGKMQGKGIFRQPDGRYYEGEFVNNEVHGQGITYDAKGNVLKQGQWAHNEFIGPALGSFGAEHIIAPKSTSINSLYFFSSAYGNNGSFVKLDMNSMAIQSLGLEGNNVTVSTDGKYLVYQGKSDRFHAYDLDSGTDKDLVQDRAYCSAPAAISKHLFAFLKGTNTGTFIYLKSVIDGAERQLPYRIPEGIRYWANIAYVPPVIKDASFVIADGPTLYFINAKATSTIYTSAEKADHIRYPSVSPDGKKVAFKSDMHKGLWVINIDGTGLTQLTDVDCMYTAWSPDGRYIAFTSANSASRGILYQDIYDSSRTARGGGAFTHRIWVVGSDGSEPHPLQGADGNGVGIMGRIIWR